MTTINIDDAEFSKLHGKTILLTGCSTGIGRAAVDLAFQNGANLILGDVLEKEGQAIESALGPERVLFRKCDVSQWDDVLELFQAGQTKFGGIDVVLANAGVSEVGKVFEDQIDAATGKLSAPNLTTFNVDLIGALYTVKCALHYFKKQDGKPCQLVLTGSAACFLDTPPLYNYCASKAGVMGLMRSLRTQLPKTMNVTINMVAPWMTRTPMLLPEFLRVWGDLPANEPIGVARALLIPAVRPHLNGLSLFVAGHEVVDFEEGLERTKTEWMGQKLSADVDEAQQRIIP